MAERRVGRLVSEMQESGLLADKGKPNPKCTTLVHLEDVGLTRNQSSRYQREAKLPDAGFEALVAECNKESKELTQALIIKKANGAHVGQAIGSGGLTHLANGGPAHRSPDRERISPRANCP